MKTKILLVITLAAVFSLSGVALGEGHHYPGAVFTMTNDAVGNSVLAFHRTWDGRLIYDDSYATGGVGSGDGLGNQGAVVLSQNKRLLFVVNAGSNDISVFAVKPKGLKLIDRVDSGGLRPISLSVDRRILYVLNAGGSVGGEDNITGFKIAHNGTLWQLPDSTMQLSAVSTAPAQIAFSKDGEVIVVTEKATNNILVYTVEDWGYVDGPMVYPSSGATPFGFAFGRRGQLFVSEAFGGSPDASAVSSYVVSPEGDLSVVSSSVPTHQTAACWVIVTKSGRFAYDTNAGSGSISGFRIGHDGSITPLDADGRTGVTGDGSGPLDMALSWNGRYLYSLNGGNDTISVFRVRLNGQLVPIDEKAADVPPGANGLAAY
ncbi:MAG: lactonase family protein [Deltaproteobacteria bacterium]|nr:lactonase family protein [Deltaproteobacteria bacterium]